MKKYQIIYADPPWKYNFSKDNADKIENHYPTMELEDIKNLSVPSDDNCILFLWATAPKLKEALEVMNSWGFEYKTHCIWHKKWIGMGYWFRGNHELLLVGVKGKMSPPDFNHRSDSVYSERRSNHSRKPTFFREMINKAYPNLSKVELFARKENELFDSYKGWTSIGNDIDGVDIKESLDKLITQLAEQSKKQIKLKL